MTNNSPSKLREKIKAATAKVAFLAALLERHSDESDWGVGMECKTTAIELKKLLEENKIPDEYKVAVVGRFKAGKSAFVNELLGQLLAGEETTPETATVTTFRAGNQVQAKINFIGEKDWLELKNLYQKDQKDPDAQRIKKWLSFDKSTQSENRSEASELFNLEEIEKEYVKDAEFTADILPLEGGDTKERKKNLRGFSDKVKQFTKASAPHHCLVESIEITAPSALLSEGILLIDTPGVDDTERFRVSLTENVVRQVDAVLFLTKSGAAYGQAEKDFLLSLLRKGTVKQLLFVVTQVDHTYDQHRKQARHQSDEPESLVERIKFERRRIAEEVDATLTALTESSNSPAMLRYREQLGNVEIVFTSAFNHRDWKAKERVDYPLSETDPGGINGVTDTLLRILSTESRMALVARNIESGARSLLEYLLKIIDSRLQAIRSQPNREVAERKLSTFLEQFATATEQFSTVTAVDAKLLKAAIDAKGKYVEAMITVIVLQAGAVISDYEVSDAGKHWRSRRSGYWGYMYKLQSRAANQIFPRVSELLSDLTDEFSQFISKFKEHLNALGQNSSEIAQAVDLGADVHLDLASHLSEFVDKFLEQTNEIVQAEEGNIIGLLDEFVSEEVEDRITDKRSKVSDIWGRGTSAAQTQQVRQFYAEVKGILSEALAEHIRSRHKEFAEHLVKNAKQLPQRAISESKKEVARIKSDIRAAAEATIQGKREAYEAFANATSGDIRAAVELLDELVDQMRGSVGADSSREQAANVAFEETAPAADTAQRENSLVYEDCAKECLSFDDFDEIKARANKLVLRLQLRKGTSRWPFSRLFEKRYLTGITALLVVDPYLMGWYQMRNLNEFLNWVLQVAKLRRVFIVTGENADPQSAGSDARLGELATQLHNEAGAELIWRRDAGIHDRYVSVSSGFLFKLGRGLDIYQPASGLAASNQELRRVKDCEVDVFSALTKRP